MSVAVAYGERSTCSIPQPAILASEVSECWTYGVTRKHRVIVSRNDAMNMFFSLVYDLGLSSTATVTPSATKNCKAEMTTSLSPTPRASIRLCSLGVATTSGANSFERYSPWGDGLSIWATRHRLESHSAVLGIWTSRSNGWPKAGLSTTASRDCCRASNGGGSTE